MNFIALKIEGLTAQDIMSLTPRIMQWSENIWLLDLRLCRSYWELRASHGGMTLNALLHDRLTSLAGEKQDQFIGAIAGHPWQALIMQAHMERRGLNGLSIEGSSFTDAFYQSLSWEAWFHCARHIMPFLVNSSAAQELMRQHIRRMVLAMAGLGLKGPWEFRRTSVAAIKRRFGQSLAILWEWTFPATKGARERLIVDEFPWRIWQEPDPPQIKRHLDYPLWQWEHVHELLREDLDRLCGDPRWDFRLERVLLLEWTLIRGDVSQQHVCVRFRYPHDLSRELGSHRTSLLQASYAFATAISAAEGADFVEPVIGWRLVLSERIHRPLTMRRLLDEEAEDPDAMTKFMAVANQLAMPLKRYDLCEDWLPEAAFDDRAVVTESHGTGPWLNAARERPLCAQPLPVALASIFSVNLRGHFLERVGTKWWKTVDDGASHRDYYRLIDRYGAAQWVFRTASGAWFRHGFFS